MKNFDHGGNIFAVARLLNLPPEEILDFSASINPLGPAPEVRKAVAEAFDLLVHYPDSDCSELREALARYHCLTAGNFFVTNGSTELIYLLPRLVGTRRALVVAPPFSEYARAVAREGGETDYFTLTPADGFALPLKMLAENIGRGYDLLVLGNPGNPTGRLYSLAETEQLYRICQERGVFLVLDEAFIDFCEESSAKHLAAAEEGILILRSMTKFHALPGLRLGYAIGAHGTVSRLTQLRVPWSVNTLAQVAGVTSLAAAAHAEATRQLVAAERRRLFAQLSDIQGLRPFPSAANYLLVEITGAPTAEELAALLLRERILIRDCAGFQGLNERFFRIAVRSREENDRLLELLTALFEG